ncbi:MAG: hypothetical protein HQL11_04800, partial [Candidatus Omnitrophica bacterium]|nr:hypothetical protein [Candidatus Omnitrophota bacterium]
MVLSAIFIFEQALLAAPIGAASADAPSTQSPSFATPSFTSAAVIDEIYTPESAATDSPLIYLIQDAHTNFSGQLNLAATLSELWSIEEGLGYVFVEAGDGDSSMSFLRGYADAEKRRETALKYLRRGELHGEEYLDIVSDLNMRIWGVEDRRLYQGALELYRLVVSSRESSEKTLGIFKSSLAALKARVFSPALTVFDAQAYRYQQGGTPVVEYAEYLSREASRLGMPEEEASALLALEELRLKESGLDFSRADAQARELMNIVNIEGRAVVDGAHEDFLLGRWKHRGPELGRERLEVLRQKALSLRAQEGGSSEAYGEFLAYCDYEAGAQQVASSGLLDEIEELTESVYARLADTRSRRGLVEAGR